MCKELILRLEGKEGGLSEINQLRLCGRAFWKFRETEAVKKLLELAVARRIEVKWA